MTQPTQVPIQVDVTGADEGAQQLDQLQQVMGAVTIGAVAMDRSFSGSSFGRRGGLLGSGFTAEAIDQQKMLSGLAGTAAVTGQSYRGLRGDVESLARSLPGGTQQMVASVQAAQQLGLSQRNQIGQIRAIAAEGTRLAAATGGFAPQMTQQFGELNREMASLDPSRLSKFADVVTTLQAKTGASATGTLSFAQSIGPVAQQAGLGESAILGMSAAFTKLGDDGGAAATAVNRILSDLNQSVKEGADTMVTYANATGMTVKQFRALYQANPAAAVEKVVQSLGGGSGQSMYLLQSLGLDSARTTRAIAELQQSGGLQATINTAVGSYGNGSTQKASDAVFNNIEDKTQRLTTTLGQLGTAGVAPVLGPLGDLLDVFQKLAQPVAAIASSRIGQDALTAGVLGGGAALLGSRGAFGLMAHLNPLAWAAQLVSSGPIVSSIAGARTGRAIAGGAEDLEDIVGAASMRGRGLFGGFGRNVNTSVYRGATGGRMGGRTMGGVNQWFYDAGQGWGGMRAGTTTADEVGEGLSRGRSPMLARGLSGLATAGSLGLQGWTRLFTQPFRMARLPAADREFDFTTPGGPGRKLLTGLKGAWTDRDGAAAGQAVKDAAKDMGGLGQAVKRTVGSFGELTSATGGFIASIGRTAGGGLMSLLSSSAGKMGLAGLGIGAAGFAGYELWKGRNGSANDWNAGDESNMYSAVNSYRDSLGLAGESVVSFSQEIQQATANVAATITTFKRASTLTTADTQSFGTPNAKKVTSYYQGTHAQVAAQISAQYAGVGITPQDMQAVKQDLYNQGFAGSDIDSILKQVSAGTTLSNGQISSLVSATGAQTGLKYGSIGEKVKEGLNPGTLFGRTIGSTGGGSPMISSQGKRDLGALGTGILQQAQSAYETGGAKYAVTTEVASANKALTDALGTHNQSLIVATEQQLTKTLTGKAVTGQNAGIIGALGNIQNLVGAFGGKDAKIAGRTLAQWQAMGIDFNSISPAQVLQSTAITALRGGNRSTFAGMFQGGGVAQSAISTAMANPANQALSTKAADTMVDSLQHAGDSLTKIATAAYRNMHISGPEGAIMQGAFQQAQFKQGIAQAGMNTGAALGSQVRAALSIVNAGPGQGDSAQLQQYQQAEQQLGTLQESERNYYQQRAMTQFNFEIQSERATQDYYIQTSRAQQDFQIQSARSEQDYLLQRFRSTQDYRTQLKREVLAASQSGDYNPYQRIEAQPVFGAADLEQNVSVQNQTMVQQLHNLNKIRTEGLSNAAIQTLQLSSSSNAQQLSQLVTDFANNPALVQQMNTEITARTKAAGGLLKDPGDTVYTQQKQDFDRQMSRSKQDYTIQQNRLEADFTLQQQRAAADFTLSMSRMGQDVADADLQITGNMKTLQADMIKILNGQAVDWKHQMTNTINDTLSAMKGLDGKVVSTLNGAAAAAKSSALGTGLANLLSGKTTLGGDLNGVVGNLLSYGAGKGGGESHGRYWAPTTASNKAFVWSELGQESGSYSALGKVMQNGDRAYGAYQIMGDNIPSWSKEILGHSLTISQFMSSPKAQDLIAQGMLLKDVKKYGYRGAASAWYSGDPSLDESTKPEPGGPSIKAYVDSVIARMGQAPKWLLELGENATKHKKHHATTGELQSNQGMTIVHGKSMAPKTGANAHDAAMITSGGRASSIHIDNRSYTEHNGTYIDTLEVKANNRKELETDLKQIQRRKNLTGVKGGPKKHG